MFFAKLIDEKHIIRCPKSGYVGKKAISNLEKFFSKKPSVAEREGYMEYIPSDKEIFGNVLYKIEDGKIVERSAENDNKIID